MLFGVFLVVALFIALVISFSPYFYQKLVYERQKKRMTYEISLLPALYEQCAFIVSDRRGEGESQNTDMEFEAAHVNQEFAVSSVLELIK